LLGGLFRQRECEATRAASDLDADELATATAIRFKSVTSASGGTRPPSLPTTREIAVESAEESSPRNPHSFASLSLI
jgi:hypothetical protein